MDVSLKIKFFTFSFCLLSLTVQQVGVAQDVIPHGQSVMPAAPISAEEAAQRMTVPEGFQVEVVAAEPDIVNPIAMAIDERGRFWITESVEYPRQDAGPGKDRIKILEDTDGDGRADKFTIFADGLNIPSGIAIGYGGVWVANSPDILFLQDTDGDDRADKSEVVVTGFGRDDTHELPNSLTWGPDGYLYGLNGVFNRSRVSQGEQHFDFTCAMFRIDPRTKRFELFAEGTSNPWGIAFDPLGNALISACVIDHLWHIAESGYYVRQGGPYPPFTWPMQSIVDHHHQQAAYCGLNYFDSDAYPEKFRNRLYMGNIHGNCLNTDRLERRGSTYFGIGEEDFLSANDAWFMPVSQKTGIDGCMYVLDWYDRYHCYQDARRDPEGIDRLKGRLYRIRYMTTVPPAQRNLMSETDSQLIASLKHPNLFIRETAQRLLAERGSPATSAELEAMARSASLALKTRLHALWARSSMPEPNIDLLRELLDDQEPEMIAWAIRLLADKRTADDQVVKELQKLCSEAPPQVLLQVATATRKIKTDTKLALLLNVLTHCGDDPLIPHIVWQNLYPLIESDQQAFSIELASVLEQPSQSLLLMLPRILERMLAIKDVQFVPISRILAQLDLTNEFELQAVETAWNMLTNRVINQEIRQERLPELSSTFSSQLSTAQEKLSFRPNGQAAITLAAAIGDKRALAALESHIEDFVVGDPATLLALRVLAFRNSDQTIELARSMLLDSRPDHSVKDTSDFRRSVISNLANFSSQKTGDFLLESFAGVDADLKPQIIEVLTSRLDWSQQLVNSVEAKRVSADWINVNQIRKLSAMPDESLKVRVANLLGRVREERNPEREALIGEMRNKLFATNGNSRNGAVVFEKTCGQCHKIYGKGFDIGPDLTESGRGSLDQLLSNVFDPSLVIGESYQARTVLTVDGLLVTGLLVEDSPQRIVLKGQGGKETTIARDDIEALKVSKLSMMPEDLEKQYTEQELIDLFAFLTLDKHPDDPNAKRIK